MDRKNRILKQVNPVKAEGFIHTRQILNHNRLSVCQPLMNDDLGIFDNPCDHVKLKKTLGPISIEGLSQNTKNESNGIFNMIRGHFALLKNKPITTPVQGTEFYIKSVGTTKSD